MKSTSVALFAVLFAVFAISAFAQTPSLQKRTITKTDKFDFGAGGTVAITGAPIGSIRIAGTGKNEIEITAEIEIQAANEADLNKLAEVTGFATDEGLARTGIISVGSYNKFGQKKLPKNFPKDLLNLPLTINYVINVPHFCDLEIDGGSGDLSITGVEGSTRVNYLKTTAKLEIAGGTTNITVGDGTVDVAFGAHGWRGRSVSIQVATGNLYVQLPNKMSAEIDASILKSGKIENTFPDLKPRDRKVPFTERSIIAKAGVGGAPLKFTVGDGTLKLSQLILPL